MGTVAPSPVFMAQMRRLLGLKFAPSDLTTHWEALQDMPEALLEAAVTHAQTASDEFPSPKMLKMFGDQLRARVVPIPVTEDRSEDNPSPTVAKLPTGRVIPLTRFWKYYCEQCSDTGWSSFWCAGIMKPGEKWPVAQRHPWVEIDRPCERHKGHGAHEWSAACACVDTNPEVQRRREADRRVKRGKDE